MVEPKHAAGDGIQAQGNDPDSGAAGVTDSDEAKEPLVLSKPRLSRRKNTIA